MITCSCGKHDWTNVKLSGAEVIKCECGSSIGPSLSQAHIAPSEGVNAELLAALRHECAKSGMHDHDGCSCSDTELLRSAALAAPPREGWVTEAMVKRMVDQPLGEFKPCVVVNQEAGITEAIFEDAAYVAKPVFDGVYHWMDELRAVDDGRLVGFQVWLTKPVASPHGREGCPHCRGEDHKCPYGDCPDERCPYRAPHGTKEK